LEKKRGRARETNKGEEEKRKNRKGQKTTPEHLEKTESTDSGKKKNENRAYAESGRGCQKSHLSRTVLTTGPKKQDPQCQK